MRKMPFHLPASVSSSLIGLALLPWMAACPEPGPPGEGEGEGEVEPPVVIGDPTAPAELSLVYRDVDGQMQDLHDGDEIPLLLPLQGGKVIYVGVKGTNVTSRINVRVGLYDDCQAPPRVVTLEGRANLLKDDGSGTAVPINDPADLVATNFANVPMCPTQAVSSVDMNDRPWRMEVNVTEQRREGEDKARTHSLITHVIPVCAEPDFAEFCDCECDEGISSDKTMEEQCPTINDDDVAPDACP